MQSLPGGGSTFCAAWCNCRGVPSSTFKNKKRRILIMRLLILAAAATLVVTGAAMARESVHRHHNASAPIAEGSAPADTLGAHDAYMHNLQDSGYNSHSDRDAFGNVRQN